eukprot:TRINITY_DN13062_c0_g1_i1.p2 TRINITY_DN13062_c0_g1~~TRINITY_DN13062_c0_g1_i1.p2  ORF type:complete len:74 (-),score=10.09 TRINITY_DN13062_c0_g1_i1:290-511(-)
MDFKDIEDLGESRNTLLQCLGADPKSRPTIGQVCKATECGIAFHFENYKDTTADADLMIEMLKKISLWIVRKF